MAKNTLSEAWEKAQPYIEGGWYVAKPYVDKSWSLTKTYLKAGARKAWPYVMYGTGAAFGASLMSAGLVYQENEDSNIQKELFSGLASQSYHYVTTDLNSASIEAPNGPYNIRLGYTLFPEIRENLINKGFSLTHKATGQTPIWHGENFFLPNVPLFPIYDEKPQAGLEIRGSQNSTIREVEYPRFIYNQYDDIPELVTQSFFFVENRERLEEVSDTRNCSIEVDRKVRAVVEHFLSGNGAGGSTINEQLVKMRHSEGGSTNRDVKRKIQQILTASARTYSENPENVRDMCDRQAADYINGIPQAGTQDHGEILGMKDSLVIWFNTDLDDYDRLMRIADKDLTSEEMLRKAQYFRQTLAMVMAVQSPSAYLKEDRTVTWYRDKSFGETLSDYLGEWQWEWSYLFGDEAWEKASIEKMVQAGREYLDDRIDRFITPMREAGYISLALEQRTKAARLDWAQEVNPDLILDDTEKWANLSRINFLQLSGQESLHDLDRMDIQVTSTIDAEAVQVVNAVLNDLSDPNTEHGQTIISNPDAELRDGLADESIMDEIRYSFTLYEQKNGHNHLRVQTDSFDGAFNVNEDSMLELGSTAKLRTVITYLEVALAVYQKLADIPSSDIPDLPEGQLRKDGITAWVYEYLKNPENVRTEEAFIQAAWQRKYWANPEQSFFSGGGSHGFVNFDNKYDHLRVTVEESFQRSINLPFVGMMEDIVHYYIYNVMGFDDSIYTDPEHPLRDKYLTDYAYHDARQHFDKYYKQYEGLDAQQAHDLAFSKIIDGNHDAHIAALYRYLYPEVAFDEFSAFVKENAGEKSQEGLTLDRLEELYSESAIGSQAIPNLNARSYVTSIHPFEMWLAAQLVKDPSLGFGPLQRGALALVPEVYDWLNTTDTEDKHPQRIFIILEKQAFDHIHDNWQEKGFPFEKLIPSVATSIGVSGDTPAALADLIGIVNNNGVRQPKADFTSVVLGEGTPYEERFTYTNDRTRQVLHPEIARTVKANLENVVENGTGRRAKDTIILSDGQEWQVGGKTGTGDNRFEVRDEHGNVERSTARNRTATFVFTFGDRYFGTVVAYADGENADTHQFTSALPVQAFKLIMKDLTPILEQRQNQDQGQDLIQQAEKDKPEAFKAPGLG